VFRSLQISQKVVGEILILILGAFLQIAMGSASETEYELILACDLEFLSKSRFEELQSKAEEVKKCWLHCSKHCEPVTDS